MGRGGRRPGAGRPRGSRSSTSLDKAAAREQVRQRITADLIRLVEAQIANALGIKYLVVRQKSTGKFLRVGQSLAKLKIGNDEEVLEVWEKDPSVQAFTDLMNRALDRPKEQELDVHVHDTDSLVARLALARRRANRGTV